MALSCCHGERPWRRSSLGPTAHSVTCKTDARSMCPDTARVAPTGDNRRHGLHVYMVTKPATRQPVELPSRGRIRKATVLPPTAVAGTAACNRARQRVTGWCPLRPLPRPRRTDAPLSAATRHAGMRRPSVSSPLCSRRRIPEPHIPYCSHQTRRIRSDIYVLRTR